MASPLFILHRIFCYFLKWKAEIHALFLQVPLLAQFKVIDARCTHRRYYEEELVVVKVAQSRPTLRDPMAYTVRGSLQARTLKWVAFPFSRGSSHPRGGTEVFCIGRWIPSCWTTREVPPTLLLLKKVKQK